MSCIFHGAKSQSKAPTTKIMSILGAFAACVFSVTIPSVYYAISITGLRHDLATEAAFFAKSIDGIIQTRPDLWEYESLRLKEIISQPSVNSDEHEREIRTTEGKLVAKNDVQGTRPKITVSARFFDSGRLAGSIVIRHSIRSYVITTALLGILSSIFGYLIYFIFRSYPIRQLENTLTDLHRERDKYEKTLYAIGDGVIAVDRKGTILFINRVAESLIGMDASESIGRRLEEVYVVRRNQANDAGERGCILTGRRGNEYAIEEVRTHMSEVESNNGGVVIVFRDVTARKQAEEERRILEERLLRAEKMEALGQLAGGVAHDLNNVLGILSGYSELLLDEIPEGHRSRGHVEKIMQSTEKGAAIIQDLLTLARRGVTASEVINLNSIVSTFLKSPVFEKLKSHHPRVTFRAECQEDLLNIKGSPGHLGKTLMNLVSNAAESIGGEGEVTILLGNRYLDTPVKGYDQVKQGDYVVLSVSDTGMGIPAENIGKIFEPFYTKKTMGRSGTGLGLAIVWGTVKDHHGYIDLRTEIGKGTTFSLYFPVTREETISQPQKKPIEKYMSRGESVLVVDDVPEQRDVAARLLTKLGYEVHVVSSGEEAVEYLKTNKADLLVLDMIMTPGIDGLETYQRVLEISPKQKAILVSGFSETDRVKKAQELGAGAYVKKPYVMEKIGVAIRDELSR